MRRRIAPALVTLAAVAWLAALLIAPLSAEGGSVVARSAALCYAAGSLICHQRADRSFHVSGAQLPVCARCTGLYAGAALGAVLWMATMAVRRSGADSPARRARAGTVRAILIGSAAPTLVTLATAALGWWDPGNATRALLALPLGAAVGAAVTAVAAGDLR